MIDLHDRNSIIAWCRDNFDYDIVEVPIPRFRYGFFYLARATFNPDSLRVRLGQDADSIAVLHEIGHGQTWNRVDMPNRQDYGCIIHEGTAWHWAITTWIRLGGNPHDVYESFRGSLVSYGATRQQCRKFFFDILRGAKTCSKP